MDFTTLAGRFPGGAPVAAAEILYGRVLHGTWERAIIVGDTDQLIIPAAVAAAMAKRGVGRVNVVCTSHLFAGLLENVPELARILKNLDTPKGVSNALHGQLHAMKKPEFDLAVLPCSENVETYGLHAVQCERLVKAGGMVALAGLDVHGCATVARATLELLGRLYPAVCSCASDTHWGWAQKGARDVVGLQGQAEQTAAPAAKKPATLQCPLCESAVEAFLPFGLTKRVNAKCPNCGALERHRLFWCYVKAFTNLFDGNPKSLLHVAPEQILADKLLAIPGVDYLSADLDSPRAMVKMDLTDIQYPEGTWDVILCSHVLEHIPDDRKAMSEMYRTLKPGGWLIVQVPTYGDTTYEDWSITTEEGRLAAFHQKDHVRKYGTDIVERLQGAGFSVKMERPATMFDAATVRKHALKDQYLFYCEKC